LVNSARRRFLATTALVAAIASLFCPAITHEGEYLALGLAIVTEGPAPIFIFEYLVYCVILFAFVTLTVTALVAVVRRVPRWTRRLVRIVRSRDYEDFGD